MRQNDAKWGSFAKLTTIFSTGKLQTSSNSSLSLSLRTPIGWTNMNECGIFTPQGWYVNYGESETHTALQLTFQCYLLSVSDIFPPFRHRLLKVFRGHVGHMFDPFFCRTTSVSNALKTCTDAATDCSTSPCWSAFQSEAQGFCFCGNCSSTRTLKMIPTRPEAEESFDWAIVSGLFWTQLVGLCALNFNLAMPMWWESLVLGTLSWNPPVKTM